MPGNKNTQVIIQVKTTISILATSFVIVFISGGLAAMAILAAGDMVTRASAENINRPSVGLQRSGRSNDAGLAEANGMYLLKPGEFAIIKNESGNKKADIIHGVQLAPGLSIDVTSSENTNIEVIAGSSETKNYVSIASANVNIVTAEDVFSSPKYAKEKIDGLARYYLNEKPSGETVSVIIKMKTDYGDFYVKNQGADRIAEKKEKFNNVKGIINSLMRGKSKVKGNLELINAVAAEIDADSLVALELSGDVEKVEYDKPKQLLLNTSVDQINTKSAWQLFDTANNPMTGVGMVIAVIDTGVDYTHPDLGGCLGANCKVIGGYDFVNKDNDPMDDHGHGTHVAATAAGKGMVGSTMLYGVAPDAKILAYKVLNASGSGYSTDIIAAIQRSVDPNNDGNSSDHADVGNMSLGGGGNPDDASSLAVDKASAAGVIYAIAGGNSGPGASSIGSPGTSRTAITVAAACKPSQVGISSTCSTPIASFSSRGPVIWNGVDIKKPDISAPGVLICAAEWASAWSSSRCFDTKHVSISGTSMAAPHMAGVAALMRQAYPAYTVQQIKDALWNHSFQS